MFKPIYDSILKECLHSWLGSRSLYLHPRYMNLQVYTLGVNKFCATEPFFKNEISLGIPVG